MYKLLGIHKRSATVGSSELCKGDAITWSAARCVFLLLCAASLPPRLSEGSFMIFWPKEIGGVNLPGFLMCHNQVYPSVSKCIQVSKNEWTSTAKSLLFICSMWHPNQNKFASIHSPTVCGSAARGYCYPTHSEAALWISVVQWIPKSLAGGGGSKASEVLEEMWKKELGTRRTCWERVCV